MKLLGNALCTLMLLASLPVFAVAPPAWINYQGRLLDNAGIPVTATGVDFIVSIWSDPASTAPVHLKYKESHVVNVNDGVYSFPVGSGTPISGTYGGSLYANNGVLWLELTVETETLSPRHRLLSAPYTNHSGNSENLGGQPVSYFGTAAADESLQWQINNLADQLAALQSVCESGGNVWDQDTSTCLKGVKVIDFQGHMIPVDQDGVQLSLPDLERECMQKHYRPIDNGAGPMEVLDCDFNPVESPGFYGCGFGAASEAIIVGEQNCPLMQVVKEETEVK